MAKKTLCMMVFLTLFLACAVYAANTEYLELRMNGDGMMPAILDGDTVKVKICTNGSLIKVGSQTSETPGDIIIYCAGAIVSQPQSMFTCGRAISKHLEDGHWFFKTKMDNSQEPDSWEVPEYALLGIVVEVYHKGNSPSTPPSSGSDSQNGHSTSPPDASFEPRNISTLAVDFTVGIALGLILGLVVKKGLSRGKVFGFQFPSFNLVGPTAHHGGNFVEQICVSIRV